MRTLRFSTSVAAAALATVLVAIPGTLRAQADTTRQRTDSTQRATARSEMQIPVRKNEYPIQGRVQRESGGEVMLSADRARIDSLETVATTYRERLDSIENATVALNGRTEATESMVNALKDSLNTVRTEVSAMREELAATTARTNALGDSLYRLNRQFSHFRNGSLFGNSGFYVGLGTGANFTTGTLNEIGYHEGLNVAIPIGWNKPGTTIGVRGELGVQTFDGRVTGAFVNPDPKVYSAVAMLTAHFPLSQGKTSNFYLMGGGGAYMFRDVGDRSTLRDHLGGFTASGSSTSNKTEWGVTGGAGLEFHILGATSLFVESRLTNVFAEASTQPGNDPGKNLRWVPLIAGFTLR